MKNQTRKNPIKSGTRTLFVGADRYFFPKFNVTPQFGNAGSESGFGSEPRFAKEGC